MLTNIYKSYIHYRANDFILKNTGIYVIMMIYESTERMFMKKGFTLTELMVALAVIGILVAVVTPAIMRTRPNKNKMMVKKTFYLTEQIVSSLINDEIVYPDMREACRTGEDNGADIYCAWGFDYTDAAEQEGETYEGGNKFGALFKSRLNVKANDSDSKDGEAPNGTDYYPVFYTSDGVKWDLTGTKDAWEFDKIPGKFEDNFDDDGSAKASPSNGAAGGGIIAIDVNGDEGPNQACTGEDGTEDCDQYEIQLLVTGKMRINPAHARAINWVSINPSTRDN